MVESQPKDGARVAAPVLCTIPFFQVTMLIEIPTTQATAIETQWFIDLDLSFLPEVRKACLGEWELLHPSAIEQQAVNLKPVRTLLEACASFSIKHFSQEGKERVTTKKEVFARIRAVQKPDRVQVFAQIPKGRASKVKSYLSAFRIPLKIETRPAFPGNLASLLLPIPNPKAGLDGHPDFIELEELQIKALTPLVEQGENGVLEYPMGGGKSIAIVALLRAFSNLRPAVVTSSGAADSLNLARTIAKALPDQEVSLIGCTSVRMPAHEKKALFSKVSDCTDILVGTHELYNRLAKAPASEMPFGPIRLCILDEIHESCSLKRMESLSSLDPRLCIGATATWLDRWNKADRIMANLLHLKGSKHRNKVASHADTVDSGRNAKVGLFAYDFDRLRSPDESKGFKGYDAFQILGENCRPRNQMIACQLVDLAEFNEDFGLGCIMVFTNTIGHSKNIAREFCSLKDLPFSQGALEFGNAAIYNSKLPPAEKSSILNRIRDRKIAIIFTTDSLSTGIDYDYIYDIFDATVTKKMDRSIQRSGRSVRSSKADPNKKAKIHLVREVVSPQADPDEIPDEVKIIAGISDSKIERFAEYYGVRPKIVPHGARPWA